MIRYIKTKLQEEVIFAVASILAIATSFIVKPSIEAIDFKVLFSLFNLMLVSLAFRKYRLLDKIAVFILTQVKSQRSIGITMILTTAALGMLITNDVALITIVPVTILMAKKAGYDPYKTIVLETIAANVGGCLTPFGNPQNLYLYNYFHIKTAEFFLIMLPFCILSMLALLLINLKNSKVPMIFRLHEVELKSKNRTALYIGLFILVLLSILRIIDYRIIAVIVAGMVFFFDRMLFKQVDYYLLGTFFSFFILIDNVTRLEYVHTLARAVLSSPSKVFAVSALASQIISNVPAAILLSGFTMHYQALLLGVSVGGVGTLIASLANLISYKIYLKSYKKTAYRSYYCKVNSGLFIVFFALVLVCLNFI